MSDNKNSVPTTTKNEKPPLSRISYLNLMLHHGCINSAISEYEYPGSGTLQDPYVVSWIPNDPRNPNLARDSTKWFWTMLCSFSNFAVTIATSAYAAHAKETRAEFHASQEVFELGFSLFVVGFAVGPLFWGPLSEVYGRQIIIVGTFIVFTGFNIGCAVAPNMAGLIIMRFLAGSFGASPWTNAGGVVADIWPIRQRGMAMVVLSAAPLFGPAMGPIVGGFISENCGWRWVEGFLAIFSGSLCILVALFVPETYGPLLLQRRAQELSKRSGKYYISKLDKDKHQSTLGKTLKVALTRPWLLLLHEPIVLVLSIYSALLYGTVTYPLFEDRILLIMT
ncbi:hypothetical protein ACMFMG_007581 [Clarireedia jacksonii]